MPYQHSHLKSTIYLLTAIFVYSSAFYFFSFITADPDLWGHIKFGQDLWETKTLPGVDSYSYTAMGNEWINHEWLSELLMYSVFSKFGSPGLLIGKMLIGLIIISLVSLICFKRKVRPVSYCITLVLSSFIMSPGFMLRPHLMTFFFSTLFFTVIYLFLKEKRNILWALPLIMILWVNSHGGFIIGAGILPVITFLEFINCHIDKKDKSHLRSMIIWMLITEASMLINPYGYNLLVFIYKTLSQPRSISEWESVSLFGFSYMRFKLFTIFVILSFFIQRNRNSYWEIGLILITMIFAFLHQRHTPIFAILAAPFFAEKLSGIEEELTIKRRVLSSCSYIIMIIFLIFIITYQLSTTINKYIKADFNIIVDPDLYPVKAVRFLEENRIKGNLLVPFEWGEYAIWKLYLDNKVSIDGRFRTVYPEYVINDHFRAVINEADWKLLLEKYPTDIVLARRGPFSQKMITDTSSDWIYIYSDNISIIFLKKGNQMKEVIDRFRNRELTYSEDNVDIYFP